MMRNDNDPNDIQSVVKGGLCIGCGLCTYSDAVASMRYSKEYAQSVPVISETNGCENLAFAICPGKGYTIVADSHELFGSGAYDVELGHTRAYFAAHSNDPKILRNASSGGIMSHLAIALLGGGYVDRVLVAHFEYSPEPRAMAVLADSQDEILRAQGSKYCPVDLSCAIRDIKHNNYKVAVLGTPCQIAGIRQIQRIDPPFDRKIFMTISTFCGGVKSYDNLDLLAHRHGIEPNEVEFFRFRGNGQPGSMLIKDHSGRQVEVPYPTYVGHTGFSKHLRCHLCVDATGELADIACGDAWLPRFENGKYPWSIVIARNEKATDLLHSMISKCMITTADVSLSEIRLSQRDNLTSKKARQKSRRYLYRLLRISTPSFDGGYHDARLSILLEIKVLLKHRFKILLERMHIFYAVYNFVRRASRVTSWLSNLTCSGFGTKDTRA